MSTKLAHQSSFNSDTSQKVLYDLTQVDINIQDRISKASSLATLISKASVCDFFSIFLDSGDFQMYPQANKIIIRNQNIRISSSDISDKNNDILSFYWDGKEILRITGMTRKVRKAPKKVFAITPNSNELQHIGSFDYKKKFRYISLFDNKGRLLHYLEDGLQHERRHKRGGFFEALFSSFKCMFEKQQQADSAKNEINLIDSKDLVRMKSLGNARYKNHRAYISNDKRSSENILEHGLNLSSNVLIEVEKIIIVAALAAEQRMLYEYKEEILSPLK
mmetsp:Transcript_29663/g.27122  ORF Transcript_29663/g.27122 Transcript_29663/m.27122 type:complete len:277 (-) Transcript_29663:274-1104(-)